MTYTPEQVTALIAMLRSLPGFEHLPDTDLAVRAADALEAEHRRAEEAEAACETLEHEYVDHRVRHAEWVERAEAERDRYRAAIEEVDDWMTRHYLDTHVGGIILAMTARALDVAEVPDEPTDRPNGSEEQ